MKCLIFNHSVMKTMEQGVQAFHAGIHLMRKYYGPLSTDVSVAQHNMVIDWAFNHETVAVLNGGLTQDLNRIKRLVRTTTTLPWAEFREPNYGNMVTSIAVVVPTDWHIAPYEQGYKFFRLAKGLPLAK